MDTCLCVSGGGPCIPCARAADRAEVRVRDADFVLVEGRYDLAVVKQYFGPAVAQDGESVVTSNGVTLRLWTRLNENEWVNSGVKDARELIACWEHW